MSFYLGFYGALHFSQKIYCNRFGEQTSTFFSHSSGLTITMTKRGAEVKKIRNTTLLYLYCLQLASKIYCIINFFVRAVQRIESLTFCKVTLFSELYCSKHLVLF